MHLKLRIQYDGTDFAGSQLQAEGRGRTVQGELERALAQVTGFPIRVALAGRTDSGVHAWGQVAGFELPDHPRLATPQALMRALNGVLPSDLAVTAVEEVAAQFHARFSARKRAYRYLLWTGPSKLPVLARYTLHIWRGLDTEAVAGALGLLVGTHDLASFAGSGMGVPAEQGEDRPRTVRTVYVARMLHLPAEAHPWTWEAPQLEQPSPESAEGGRLIAIDLVADAFLPQMIRNIVGTLLEVGEGKRTVDDFKRVLENRDRRLAGPTAKPHGLCLLWVEY